MVGKFTLLVLGLMALATLALAQSSIRDETEPPGSVIDIDTEISKEKEEVPEESGSGKSSDDEDDEDEDDLDKSSGSGSGGFNTDREEPPTTTMKTLKGCANLYESSKHLLGNFVPQCDDNGDYLPKQCRGHASTGRCWCVDNHGAEIPGTAKEPPNDLDCVTNKSLSQCVFKVVEAVRNPKKLLGQYKPQCKINGDFEPRQCQGSICFCVDQDGIQQYGTQKPIHLVTDDMCKEKILPEVPEESITVRVNNAVKNTKPVPTKPVNPEYTIPSKNPIVEVEAPISPDEDDSTEDKTRSPNTTGDDEDDDEDTGPLKEETKFASAPIMTQPGLLAAIIGGAVVGLLCAILLVMFIVYRMRKKDEGSYALDEPRKKSTYSPINQTDKEYYA